MFVGLPLLVVSLWVTAPSRTTADLASRIAALQNPDGGFAAERGEPSRLGITNTAIRILGFAGGSIPDPLRAIAFVLSCQDPDTGGFAQTPGGTPDVGSTASGLMALGALQAGSADRLARAAAYLAQHARAYEDVRIAAAGLEAVKLKPQALDAWKAVLLEGRNPDGTWGAGPERAFDTGGRAAALLRLGLSLDHRDAILKALLEGQQPDGGWSRDGRASDLATTYRVVRALYMMDAAPDLERLKAFVESCRDRSGLFSVAVGQEPSLSATYMALIVGRWARLLGGEPAWVETAGFRPLLVDETLSDWEGDRELWRVRDGRIIGESPGLDHNTFLIAPGRYADFELKFTFRLRDGQGNSGVQFRSEPLPPHEMSGYQADIGEAYWGCLYDESRRNRILAQASEQARAAVRPDRWNRYRIRARGHHIQLYLNDVLSVDYRETEEGIADDGRIALQIHGGPPMRIEFADLLIQPLPRPTATDLDRPGFHRRVLPDEFVARPYAVFVPEGYDGSRAFPIVLFLHGSGERGEDGVSPLQVGLGAAIAQNPSAFPFIAVFPQAQETWRAGSPDAEAALAALADVQMHYKTDPDRVYLTGLSLGGMGTWTIAASDPERWAAIVPVCGFAPVETADALRRTPTWTLIGDADSRRLLDSTRALAARLRELDAPVRYTEYREVGHNSWDRAYNDPEVIAWMLAQSRKRSEP
ncbi:MAG: hypothetical protein KatS3mg108_1221 [Isosphaeraceae bacterium]|jgi:predicted esterase|nr:MAG: hypothetical protein KatS3mg108_1221 [Isosphaeraceae bacterium]